MLFRERKHGYFSDKNQSTFYFQVNTVNIGKYSSFDFFLCVYEYMGVYITHVSKLVVLIHFGYLFNWPIIGF